MYRIFDTTLECEFPLPELPQSSTGDCSFAVKLGAPELFDATGFEKTFEWFSAAGESLCWCERRGGEYLFVFPLHARLHVTSDGVITCLVHEACSTQTLRHLLLNQIIPRYLGTNGRLVLHASAVTLENGSSIAFLGHSGWGKSTLAASFHRHGALLISDDCILLDSGRNGLTVSGGLTGIRLFPDSLHAVFHEAGGFSSYTPYTEKQQLILQCEAGSNQAMPRALDALFLLNDPGENMGDDSGDDPGQIEQTGQVRIEPVSGSVAMMAMIRCAFALDPADQQLIVRNFRNIGQSISEQLGLYSLSYPRDHDRLPEIRQAVTGRVGRSLQ